MHGALLQVSRAPLAGDLCVCVLGGRVGCFALHPQHRTCRDAVLALTTAREIHPKVFAESPVKKAFKELARTPKADGSPSANLTEGMKALRESLKTDTEVEGDAQKAEQKAEEAKRKSVIAATQLLNYRAPQPGQTADADDIGRLADAMAILKVDPKAVFERQGLVQARRSPPTTGAASEPEVRD